MSAKAIIVARIFLRPFFYLKKLVLKSHIKFLISHNLLNWITIRGKLVYLLSISAFSKINAKGTHIKASIAI